MKPWRVIERSVKHSICNRCTQLMDPSCRCIKNGMAEWTTSNHAKRKSDMVISEITTHTHTHTHTYTHTQRHISIYSQQNVSLCVCVCVLLRGTGRESPRG